MQPSLRMFVQEGGSIRAGFEPGPPESAPGQPAPRAPSGGRSAGAQSSAPAPALPLRQRIVQVIFHFQSGPLEGEHTGFPIGLVVAPPP